MSDIEVMSSELWEDLGEPFLPTVTSISGWLTANTSLLNIQIDGCYKVVSGDFVPPMCSQESGIFKQMYIVKDLEVRVRRGLDGSVFVQPVSGQTTGGAPSDWTRLQEGDSVITRASPAEMFKILKSERDSARTDLNNLILSYKMNHGRPRQVTGEDDTYPKYIQEIDIYNRRGGF